MTNDQLKELLEIGEESPRLEYKKSHPCDVEGLAKDILAMSNLRDGGTIIIGVEQRPDGSFSPSGMKPGDLQTYNGEIIKDRVGVFADPYVNFSIYFLEYNSNEFVVIVVREFDEIPVICKKDGKGLQKGTIYTRTKSRRPESARVSNHSDMREIIELAVDKGTKKLVKRGYKPILEEPSDDELFDRELEAL